jgi:pyruvate dehydrogenase E2 component (dihydrolipoamide acetyltransferase)
VSRSWAEIPHFVVNREIRAEELQAVLRSFRALSSGVTFTDVLLKTFALSLIERFDSTAIHLGLAVATPRGVAIPVLESVATSDLLSIAKARREAVERAIAGRMTAADAVVPHSSVSNLGSYGVDSFTGIVPFGQTSLLTVGAAALRPVVENGSLAVGSTLTLSLNVDHRAWDGQHAAETLARFAAIAAEPRLLLALNQPSDPTTRKTEQ